jgi:hypothetical protein
MGFNVIIVRYLAVGRKAFDRFAVVAPGMEGRCMDRDERYFV